ncbi:MAG: tRNA (N6-isopentenyl adenosine(37)-C2)-methylthiotransferase MiaB [Alphaproteobacteria bacterium]|nr:tRNA (N6-isopentenyl adenosine(37)-C2)-methylthiotransferase MiaB [Alphaproteobacteria bacterium]
MSKTLHIKTYGCQMNAYDSARMTDVLAPLGYQAVDRADDADMVILNTCHIREKATEKLFSDLGRLRLVQEARLASGRRMILAVAGCVAQAEGVEIMRRAPHVDIVFGPQTYHRLPEMVARAGRNADRRSAGILDTDFPVEPKFDHLPANGGEPGPSAFLTIQEGCDKFCTFCVVPYTRGAEYSRPVADIIAEARRLVAGGAREITLLGQNVNAYHGAAPDGRDWRLGRLIRALAELAGLDRIRYTTSHPRDMDEELIRVHGEVDACMPYLHLPVQSGSDRVLEAMNRKHRVDDYRRVVERLRAARPDIALSSDFIVGFPGETKADFEATLRLVREVGFAQAYSFRYSARPGTPAALLGNRIPKSEAGQRLAALQDLLQQQQDSFNDATVHQVVPVLFERRGRHPSQIVGRSPHFQPVHVAADTAQIGTVADVRIVGRTKHGLIGALADASCDAPVPVREAIA